MEYQEARTKFIHSWGALGSQWGINKTMAQIHALLLVSRDPLSMEDIMEELQISRGNASMNLRGLMDWGIVYKEFKPGERREFFRAEKDMDELTVKIARERSKREIQPALRVLKEVTAIGPGKSEDQKYFNAQTTKLRDFVDQADTLIAKAIEYKGNVLTRILMKILR